MYQSKKKVLAVAFTCPTNIAVGDVATLSGDLTVVKLAEESATNVVGTVIAHETGATKCTVNTPYRERRDDRTAASSTVIGPFVWDATGKCASYVKATFGQTTGTGEEPFLPVTGTTDKLKIKIDTGASQTFTLVPTDTTAALVAAKINATATDFTAVAVAGKVKLITDVLESDLIVETIANDDYTELGLAEATYAGAVSSHDPAAIAGQVIKLPDPCTVLSGNSGPFAITTGTNDKLKIKITGGSSEEVTLTQGAARTATQIVAEINTGTTGITASVAPAEKILLTADNLWINIEFETISNNAYSTLGYSVGVNAASTTVDTLEK